MKCIECNQKVNIRNIQRLCSEVSHEHIYCKNCYENLKNESDIVYCKGENCNSIIYKKEDKNSNDKEENMNKFILSTSLLMSHLLLLSNEVK